MSIRAPYAVACTLSIVAAATLALPAAHAAPAVHGVDARAQSDLRTVAVDEETYLTDFDSYGSFHDLGNDGDPVHASRGVTLRILHYFVSTGYCLEATTSTRDHFIYDSQTGAGVTAGSTCPVTTEGPSGGVRRAKSLPTGPTDALADLRNLAVAEETYLTDNNHHYGSFAQLKKDDTAFVPSAGVRDTIVWYEGSLAYCLKATAHHKTRWYASAKGGLRPVGQACGAEPSDARPGGTEQG